jgi:hypothetical protein
MAPLGRRLLIIISPLGQRVFRGRTRGARADMGLRRPAGRLCHASVSKSERAARGECGQPQARPASSPSRGGRASTSSALGVQHWDGSLQPQEGWSVQPQGRVAMLWAIRTRQTATEGNE